MLFSFVYDRFIDMHIKIPLYSEASQALKADPDLILAAVASNWRALKYASRALRSNLDFMLQCVRPEPLTRGVEASLESS